MDAVRIGCEQPVRIRCEPHLQAADHDLAAVPDQTDRQSRRCVDRDVLDAHCVTTLGRHGTAEAARQVDVGVADSHVLEVPPVVLGSREESPHTTLAVFPTRGHGVVRSAGSDAARSRVHDHAPLAVRLMGLHEILGVRRGITGGDFQIECPLLDIHRSNRALAERQRVVVDDQIAQRHLLSHAEVKGAEGGIGDDDLGRRPRPAHGQMSRLMDGKTILVAGVVARTR